MKLEHLKFLIKTGLKRVKILNNVKRVPPSFTMGSSLLTQSANYDNFFPLI
jgi:hypothetical protein